MTQFARSPCPIAVTLDSLGDKWSLLVVRDMLVGKARFADFARSPEGIPTNILADRLKRLVATGVVEKTRYAERPPRHEYRLTAKGEALLPVLQAMASWANAHVADTWVPSAEFMTREVGQRA
jgi:DNA-binding HxlR family transcriptional regulator